MINKEVALDFLKRHQPMPDDDSPQCDADLLKQYHGVMVYFREHPCDEAIPLILNSFGKGDGSGVYSLADDVLLASNPLVVVDTFCDILENPNTPPSVRYWVTVFAYGFASADASGKLLSSLSVSKELVEGLLESGGKRIRSSAEEIWDFIEQWEEGE